MTVIYKLVFHPDVTYINVNVRHSEALAYKNPTQTPQWGPNRIKKGKSVVLLRIGLEDPEGEQVYSSTLPSTLALDGGGRSTLRLGRFTPMKDPLTIV